MNGQTLINDLIEYAEKSSSEGSGNGGYRKVALIWLKHCVKDLANSQVSHHWRFLEKTATFSTVSGQHTYDRPTDIDTNKMVALYERTNDVTYKYMDYNRFVQLVADPSNNQGDPAAVWTFFGTTIRLFPVPDSTITAYLDYIKVMSNPTDDTTVLDIPDKYEDVVFKYMVAQAYRYDGDLGNYATELKRYEDAKNRMILDNMIMIGDKDSESTSHRARHDSDLEFLPLGGPYY